MALNAVLSNITLMMMHNSEKQQQKQSRQLTALRPPVVLLLVAGPKPDQAVPPLDPTVGFDATQRYGTTV